MYSTTWQRRILILSLLLLFFTIPHTLEDFATGEPAKQGIPAPLLALVVSGLFALQGLGLYGLGQGRRWGNMLHVVIGLFWPVASGLAQVPVILTATPYRAGAISIIYVGGIIVVGALLCLSAILSLMQKKANND